MPVNTNTTNDLNTPLYQIPPGKRDELIKQAYQLVLGRDPNTTELSRYKYSKTTFLELIKKLVESEEHKKLINKLNDLETVKLKAEHVLQENEYLRVELDAKKSELKSLNELLGLKNDTIAQLRENLRRVQQLLSKQSPED